MAQISYGTITITDTNDIERIYPVYCRGGESSAPALLPLSNWKENISEITVSGDYIWQRIVTKKSGINVTQNDYGDAVRLTGEEGDAALNISAVEIQYGSSANWSTSPSNWGSNTPAYDSTKPYYWTRTRLKYENNTYSSWVTNKDNGLTDAIAKSVEANTNATMAQSIAQSANENSQGAMSQAAETQYQTEALAAKVKNYWWDSTGAHIASGINGANVTEGTASTYGFNSLVGLASMTFGYNSYKTVELDGSIPALKFYKPSKTAQGGLTATLDSNGLVLSEGGVKAGTAGQSGFIYLSTKNYGSNLTINSHQASNWREIIGTKFGVDADGNLYAANAVISGQITIESGSDLSAGLSNYSTTSQMNSAIGTATSDMATKTYVGNQGYQTATQVSNTISNTNVSALNDGADYTKTANLGNTTAVQNAAKIASNYLGDTDSNAGVTLKAQNGTTTANVSTSNYIKINTSGLEVFKSGVSVALYGDTARIGRTNNSAFYINSNSLQAYYMNGSTRTLYFEVSPTGIKYGPSLNTTVATTSQIPTTVASLSDANNYATKNDAQGYANTAEAKASYSVEIQVTSIDYTNNSATLVAIPYYQGSTTIPSGVTLSYQWYKNGTALANTSTAPTISGVKTNTLQLGQGTDFGSSTTNAIYTCVIS